MIESGYQLLNKDFQCEVKKLLKNWNLYVNFSPLIYEKCVILE